MAKVCLFCNTELTSSNRAKEHVFPAWLLEEFNVEREEFFFGSHQDGFGNEKNLRQQGSFTLQQGNVCEQCNSGWMSDLEVRVSPLVRSMRVCGYTELSRSDAISLATWCVKTLALYSVTTNYRWLVTPALFAQLRSTGVPPDAHFVEIAYSGRGKAQDIQTYLSPVKRVVVENERTPHDEVRKLLADHSYVFVAKLGFLLVRVIGLPKTPSGWIRADAWNESVTRLYPRSPESLIWPYGTAYNGNIREFAYQVAVTPLSFPSSFWKRGD